MREATLVGFVHPEFIRLETIGLQRVDHPESDRIRLGDPTMGWEGDERLQLYADVPNNRWVLLRFEFDGVYRPVCTAPPGAVLAPEFVNKLIRRLTTIDSRRGYDPGEAVVSRQLDAERAEQKAWEDRVEGDLGPKMQHALKRDLG